MPDTWEDALKAYRYPVDLSKFGGAEDYPGWFETKLQKGDLAETLKFEDRFRDMAPNHLEAWYEVVFWKLYSNPLVRNKITSGVIDELEEGNITANILSVLCGLYMKNNANIPQNDHELFAAFRKMMINGDGIATAATFPAFFDPQNFPMVDRQVARWARLNGTQHSYAGCGGPELVIYPGLGESVLRDGDWAFVESWYKWCRFTADRLSELSARNWRARDVEMAVFTVQRNETSNVKLNPLYAD
ncbi:MAG: hypothetical protein OXC95_14470 [Dehalococcoidia bacterium]|nr:hypothetical protein [Dehalococcoidia bacterium]